MQRQLVHMRDQKANLIAMEMRKRQKDRDMMIDYLTLLVGFWAIAFVVTLP